LWTYFALFQRADSIQSTGWKMMRWKIDATELNKHLYFCNEIQLINYFHITCNACILIPFHPIISLTLAQLSISWIFNCFFMLTNEWTDNYCRGVGGRKVNDSMSWVYIFMWKSSHIFNCRFLMMMMNKTFICAYKLDEKNDQLTVDFLLNK
jgi:hypothetical protein